MMLEKYCLIQIGSFDACYSHMLFCMTLTTKQLEFIFQKLKRVLKPKGLVVYTVLEIPKILISSKVFIGVKICMKLKVLLFTSLAMKK